MKRRGYVSTVLSVLFLALFLFPIYWMTATSVKPQTEIFANPPAFVPSSIDLAAWNARIFNNPAIPRYFLNSLIVGVGTTLLTLLLATPAAYGLAHLPIRGKWAFILISLSSLMFPAIMLATPLFVIFSRSGAARLVHGAHYRQHRAWRCLSRWWCCGPSFCRSRPN